MRSVFIASLLPILLLSAASLALAADERRFPSIGRSAELNEIQAWDIAIGPRGVELPAGSGSVAEGAKIYAVQCAYCHGVSGTEGPDHRLVGGRGTLTHEKPMKTIGSYWPYATTLFDYIARAMPFLAPGSLTPEQVYAVTAYLLHLNGVIEQDAVVGKSDLAKINMPNRDGFIPDPRPEKF